MAASSTKRDKKGVKDGKRSAPVPPSSAGVSKAATGANASKKGDKITKKDSKSSGKGKGRAPQQFNSNGGKDNNPNSVEVNEDAVLLREIRSLGGGQEDFDLLKDVDNDEEEAIEGDATQDDVRALISHSLSAEALY